MNLLTCLVLGRDAALNSLPPSVRRTTQHRLKLKGQAEVTELRFNRPKGGKWADQDGNGL
ncbi:hypothetical protein WMY93_032866, partial [Mugilogobius chulae]